VDRRAGRRVLPVDSRRRVGLVSQEATEQRQANRRCAYFKTWRWLAEFQLRRSARCAARLRQWANHRRHCCCCV
jgi:hypothetical protein